MTHDLVTRIEGVRFTPVRLREGYDMGAVDELLDQLAEAASRGRPIQGLVDSTGLPTVRWREGYDIREVDRFLADIATAVAPPTTSRTETAYGPSFPVATTSVIEDSPGLVSRLFRRKS